MPEKNYIETIEKVKLKGGVFNTKFNCQPHMLQILSTKYTSSLKVIF